MDNKVTLLNTEFCQLDSTWNYSDLISPYHRIYLVTEGEAEIHILNRTYLLTASNMYFIPAFTKFSVHCKVSHAQYYIQFFENINIPKNHKFIHQTPASVLDQNLFRRLIEINPNRQLNNYDPKVFDTKKNFEIWKRNAELQLINLQLETQGIIMQLFSRFIIEDTISHEGQVLFKAVLEYINTNLGEKIKIKTLADIVNLEPNYFIRKFNKLMYVSPIDYIIQRRLESAQVLVVTTDLNFKQIAERVGFYDASVFSRMFKRQIGYTPKEYRLMNR